jgi:hypothetical protein
VYPQPPEYPLRIQIAARCAGHSAGQGAEHADADDPPQIRCLTTPRVPDASIAEMVRVARMRRRTRELICDSNRGDERQGFLQT